MSILTGEAIKAEVKAGNIAITPYLEENVQPASIDLRLGSGVKLYSSQVDYDQVMEKRCGGMQGSSIRAAIIGSTLESYALNPAKPLATHNIVLDKNGFLLQPGFLYLMHTLERIHTDKYVSVLDGKSSIGRLGVVVHLTAGYGDPGFDGQYTLEVTCIHPVILFPGMKIAQMRFHLLDGELNMNYATKGHYVGDKALGAIPSMAYKQFE